FSSGSRHTRLQGDWSSDVCSSDLTAKDFVVAHASDRQTADRHYLFSWALAYYLTFDRGLLGSAKMDLYVRGLKRGNDPLAMFQEDRKSTRLNSSHLVISYAVFCLK